MRASSPRATDSSIKELPLPVTTPIFSIISGPPSMTWTAPSRIRPSSAESDPLVMPSAFVPHQPTSTFSYPPNCPPISRRKALARRMEFPTSGWLSSGRWQEYRPILPSINFCIFRKCRPVTGSNPLQKSPWCTIKRSAPLSTASAIVHSDESTATATCAISSGPSTCSPFNA